MTSQGFYIGRVGRVLLVLAGLALATMVAAGTAGARIPAPQQKSALQCGTGYKAVTKVVRKHGKTTIIRSCKKKPATATAPSAAPTSSSSSSGPAPPATPAVVTLTTPAVITPPTEPEVVPPAEEEVLTTSEPEVHAIIGQGFKQNPVVPNEVTWRYSATATRTVTTKGGEKTESVPLPKGVLAFFVDGKLECEINAGGAIAASACTVVLQQLGEHEVETIFSGDDTSDTVSRFDLIGRYPTQSNVQVSIEPVPPQYRVVGYTKTLQSYPIYGFEVGRVHITGATSPSGYPTYDCEGLGTGCLIPEGASLASHHGSVNLPLFAKHARNPVTEREEWHVAFAAYDEALQESGDFWQYPDESVGTQYLHLVSEPNTTLYAPSSTTVPLDLRGGHYPLYREIATGEGGGPIAAVEGVPQKAMTIGTYDKLGGGEYWLKFSGTFNNVTGEGEGCRYELRIDGVDRGENRKVSSNHFEFLNGYPDLAPGPHTFEVWTERAAGAGPGNCAIRFGWFESYEVLH